MKNQLYIDIHVLETVPPSCVNRDDMGSPKTAVYGGTTRARVSSQAWKHEMRKEFTKIFDEFQCSYRTKLVIPKIADEIQAIDNKMKYDECLVLARKAAEYLEIKNKDKNDGEAEKKKTTPKDDKTKTLLFAGDLQIKTVAKLIYKGESNPKKYLAAFNEKMPVDIALFGRMVAGKGNLGCDAAAQVAHSISTHTVHNEYDYFTAVDDCSPEDNAGAGHLGTIEFNSSTLYRYATVNANELFGNLGELTPQVVRGFVKAFVLSMPTGKQNTFANRTVPDGIYVTVRFDQPINLCGAFEKPVTSSDGGYAEKSVKALSDYAKKVYDNYSAKPNAAWSVGDGLENISDKTTFPELLESVEKAVRERLAESEEK